ncbi:MAG: hypothetical protein ABSF82_07915 [Candidatus Bathyarchaeia archaeon]
MDAKQQMKYSYLVTAVGVVLMAISAIYGAIRALFVREMFRPNGNFNGNFTRNFNGTFVGSRQFAGGNPFGLTNALTIIAVVIALVGLVWLGLVLRKSPKSAAN